MWRNLSKRDSVQREKPADRRSAPVTKPKARLNFAMSVNDPTRNLRYPPKGTNLLNPNSAPTKKHQRFGLRSGNGIPAWVLAISAARAAASSLGGGGPDSLLASTLRIGTGIISALTGCGSKPPAVSTVLHFLQLREYYADRPFASWEPVSFLAV